MSMKTGFRFQVSGFRKILRRCSNFLRAPTVPSGLKAGNRGFTLLLAALIASIVLALGAAIFSIAQKEVALSSIGRDSQFAFYAADTVAECALYWDFRFGYFATSTPANAQNPTCEGQLLNATGRSDTYPYTMTSQQMDFFQDVSPVGGYCTEVSVQKCDGPISTNGTCTHSSPPVIHTVIHANGYSTNCASVLESPRSLQRTVELHY